MALFGWDNPLEAGGTALAVSASAAGFGAEMLRVPIGTPAVAWQTPAGVTSASLTVTPAAPVAWRAVCFSRTNLTTGATIRVRAGAYDSGVVSAGVAKGIMQALHVLPSAVTAASIQIDIADPANPDGLLNIPLAFVGPAQDFGWAASQSNYGVEARRADTTTRGGVVITAPLSMGRSWQITVGLAWDSALAWLDQLEASAAAGRNVLFVPRLPPYPRTAAETIFGLLTPGRRGFISVSGQLRNWSGTITERL